MKRFSIQSYAFGELAQMYYPNHPYQLALRRFREEMHKTRGMWAAMVAEGYKERSRILTRAQVQVIVQFLGEP
jgi:hypothetical protein